MLPSVTDAEIVTSFFCFFWRKELIIGEYLQALAHRRETLYEALLKLKEGQPYRPSIVVRQ